MIKVITYQTLYHSMSAGDICKGCKHPRGAHLDIKGNPCKCGGAGSACSCTRFDQ